MAGLGQGTTALRLLAAAGVFGSVLTGGWTANVGWRLWRAPDRPTPSTVAAAPDHRWVSLEDAVLECPPPGSAGRIVPAHASDGASRFLVYLADPERCATITRLDGAFIGTFSRATLRMQGARIPPGAADERVFSQVDAPRFFRRQLGRGLTWFGGCLLVTMLAIRAIWQREAANAERARVSKSGRAAARE